MIVKYSLAALLASAIAAPSFAQPVELVTKVFTERRVAAKDGTTRLELKASGHAVPGDRIVYAVSYRNTGAQPVDNFVLANPVPQGIVFAAPGEGGAIPELSVDGRTFGPLVALRVTAPGGARAARLEDVRAVRWRLDRPLAPGASGTFSFRAVVR